MQQEQNRQKLNQVASALASSNIALIKYMGKADAAHNLPANHSLSLTLNGLDTKVVIFKSDQDQDQWIPLQEDGFEVIHLSEKGQLRFLKHFQFLKRQFEIEGHFVIASANNFPSDCGLASSASSFAALTRATAQLAKHKELSDESLALFSQKGSGSSGRSLLNGWVQWSQDGSVRKVLENESLIDPNNLVHVVLFADKSMKEVSSSQAHQRVMTSSLYKGRPQRANERLEFLKTALVQSSWREAFEICWAEFWDMHALFETSQPHFGYMNELSLKILRWLDSRWSQAGSGPLVTMDAGANVHAIFKKSDFLQWQMDLEKSFTPEQYLVTHLG